MLRFFSSLLGEIRRFEQIVRSAIPGSTSPPVLHCEHKVLKAKKSDTSGVLVTYIPQSKGDPVQSSLEDKFFFRNGDGFTVAPYEMVKRLFAATASPELHPGFSPGITNPNVTKRARRDLSPPPKNGPYVPVAPLQLESPGVARRNADLEAVQGRHPLASA